MRTRQEDENMIDWMDRRGTPSKRADDHVRFTVTLYPRRATRYVVISDLSSSVPVNGTVESRPRRG
jgi:hypothetical protein